MTRSGLLCRSVLYIALVRDGSVSVGVELLLDAVECGRVFSGKITPALVSQCLNDVYGRIDL